MDIHKVELYLTSAQKSKFLKGMNFQMTNSQLQSKNGKHKIDPNLSKNPRSFQKNFFLKAV